MDFEQKTTLDFASKAFPRRNPQGHKGSFGRILIVAGGAGMTGAAVFSASAAMRTGSGLVYVCTPKANYPVVQTLIPEAVCIDWNQAHQRITSTNLQEWNYDAIAFGPGMGTSSAAKRMLKAILLGYTGPLVLDADGLNLIAGDSELQRFASQYTGELIITPHVGEAKRLLSDLVERDGLDRGQLADALINSYQCIVVMKGHGTIVGRKRLGSPERQNEFYVNDSGNSGMATAGSGDVLTGVIASLLGQGMQSFDAARAGVYLHGYAGDLAAMEKGEHGMIASDIIASLPYAIKDIISNSTKENSTGE